MKLPTPKKALVIGPIQDDETIDYGKALYKWAKNRCGINSYKIYNNLIKYHLECIFAFGSTLPITRIFKISSKKCINIYTIIVQNYISVDSSIWAA